MTAFILSLLFTFGLVVLGLMAAAPYVAAANPDACGDPAVRPEDVALVCTCCHQVYGGNRNGTVTFQGICDHCWQDYAPAQVRRAEDLEPEPAAPALSIH